jgi:cyanophycinase
LSPARSRDGVERGYIIPIGGAEKKVRDKKILSRFAELCGGERARIAIIPTASEQKDTGRRYEKVFRDIGVRETRSYPFEERDESAREDWLKELSEADGIFLTGGNQLRLSTTLGGTPAAQLIRRMNADGVHVAGTSAGAGFMSEHMIAFGDEGLSPRADMVTLAPGLGLTNRVIVDHHFRKRDRFGRLLTAISYNPFSVGLGLAEDTAALIGPDDVIEVMGSGAVTIVDPSRLEYSSMDSVRERDPVCLVGLRVHSLVEGWSFDLERRTAQVAGARASG